MAKRGGKREGAGRKKGSANAKTREIANRAAESGITPLEVMIEAMREMWKNAQSQTDEDQKLTRMAAAAGLAKDAAPYIHAKLANVEIQQLDKDGEPTDPVGKSDAELLARYGILNTKERE